MGGGPLRPRTQGKPPTKIPTTPHRNPRSRVTSFPSPSPPTPLLCSTDAFKKNKGNTSQGYSILISQNHPSQTSIEDAFFSGSGLADKKHFTVHVEHRFFFFIFYLLFLVFHFYFSFSLFALRSGVSLSGGTDNTEICSFCPNGLVGLN